ncbi:hypothetical protein GS415_06390 [Rhodococcus hoagii]|nr:hypothetical protein [Prescottella equi]
MALLYAAQLSPHQAGADRGWLPSSPYYDGASPRSSRSAAYRVRRSDGEVGIEVASGARRRRHALAGAVVRTARRPLPGARPAGEMEHSVLGRRYVYDATTDPVFVQQTARCRPRRPTRGGPVRARRRRRAPEDRQFRARVGDGRRRCPGPLVSDVRVSADGTDTVIEAGVTTVVVHHRPVGGEPTGPRCWANGTVAEAFLATLR